MIRFLPGLLVLLLWLYCIVDVISAREDGIRHLGKTIWMLIVFFFPLVGSLAWLIAGRPQAERPLTRAEGAAPAFPEYERRGRFAATDPEEDAEFLRKVRERAEEQRRRYEEQKRREKEAAEADPQADPDADPDHAADPDNV